MEISVRVEGVERMEGFSGENGGIGEKSTIRMWGVVGICGQLSKGVPTS